LNGVDLIRAMRPLVVAAGVQIYESTPVERVREGEVVELATPGGTIRANAIVLATNGYTPRLGYFRTGILPVISHVIATDPLPRETIARGFGTVAGFSDDLPRLAYAGIDPEGRLIFFGGGTNAAYGYRPATRRRSPRARRRADPRCAARSRSTSISPTSRSAIAGAARSASRSRATARWASAARTATSTTRSVTAFTASCSRTWPAA
jgi:glycine/D-amino acid oxidase-like deaminating enzyme